MASMSISEEDLSCPVCCDIFKDPVLLSCSHSVCKGCLQQFWRTKGTRECPVCRTRPMNAEPPLNLLLKNLCENFPKGRSQKEPFCSLHRSELKLFCEDDKQLVCLVCRDSKLHKNLNFSPISEAALERKEELKVKLKPLQNKLKKMKEAKSDSDDTAQNIRVQAQHTEKQIKNKFEKLHQILRDEEAARITALREEEEQKSQMMKEKIEKMSRDISSLSDTISAIEEGMRSDDVSFLQILQNYESTVRRAQRTLKDPERISETLNLAKHLGDMGIWERMRKIFQYTSVTLDPNTAHPRLIVSEDRTSVAFSKERQQLPDNPERFDQWANVLGSEGFNSGTHYWDVEVGNSSYWDVGFATESAKRKGVITNRSGVGYVLYKNGQYTIVSSLQPTYLLSVKKKPQRIRVKLDWDRGKVSLYDLDYNTHLHTFTHTFTERVFPYFGTQCTRVPLRILPLKDSGKFP
ncbi:hypothetical protein AALO_G00044260 [Alosa alosa]|uniref:Zinc-binding protein A33-like n=1 Tax=Alosa alosa TaxID=278164 RepID=A0AAV6HCA9_9TELE|nr:zinc-binding protein A33-like [Alosa alosa]KAG5283632.1 hypothetical protein AALO_G00044260 [Alosa alosa]